MPKVKKWFKRRRFLPSFAIKKLAVNAEPARAAAEFDKNLLDRSRTQWRSAYWAGLVKLDFDTLQHHPDRAKLALLAAAGHLQQGNIQAARQLTRLAQDWGCSKKLISQIIISGVYNSIGRAAAIGNQQHRALQHLENDITIGMPSSDAKLLTSARTGQQLHQLGLAGDTFFPQFTGGALASSLHAHRITARVKEDTKNNEPVGTADQLNREILLEEIALSKKALLAQRKLIRSFADDVERENKLVSIIIATRRPQNIDNIVINIARQAHKRLELILIPHFYSESDLQNLEDRLDTIRNKLENLIVLRLENAVKLGARLNKAIDIANGHYWAKMDDDDLYFDNYLSDMLISFYLDDYAVVGKFEQFLYLSEINKMILRFPGWHSRMSFVSGATFVVSKKNGGCLRFGEVTTGEDTALLKMAEEQKLKVYAADPFNNIVIRSPNIEDHTWQVGSEYFLKEGPVVCDYFCDDIVRV